MRNNKLVAYGIILFFAVASGFGIYKILGNSSKQDSVASHEEEVTSDTIEPLDPSIIVQAKKSRTKDHTVVLSISGLGGNVKSIAYELTYDSQGLIKGVNSGSKTIDVSGQDSFEREVYLGTCSRNVCKPDQGVEKVSVVLEFTNSSSKKSQFSKEYDL